MIALVTLLGLAACASSAALDRTYIPPSQPNNLYLPPSQRTSYVAPPAPLATPNRAYVPPTAPEKQYIPPSQPAPYTSFQQSKPNNLYLPPTTPNNVYLPPTTPNNVYLPPTTPNNVYLPPSSKPYVPPTPNNLYIPPSIKTSAPATPNNQYLPPFSSNSYTASSSSGITGAVFRQQSFASKPVAIVRQSNENNGDGIYSYSYETEDGTTAEERGQVTAYGAESTQKVQGSFSYVAPDSARYSLTYIADENGFQPQGAHLPTPPPIPEAILRSLEQNAAEEARGIVDDGSYRGESSESGYQRGAAQQSTGYPSGPGSQLGYPSGPASQLGYPKERPANGGY